MRRLIFVLSVVACLLLSGCSSSDSDGDNIVLNTLKFQATSEQIVKECDEVLAEADEGIRRIIDEKEKTFENTIAALNNVIYEEGKMLGLQELMMLVSPHASIREASREALVKLTVWSDGVFYNKQLYQAVEQYAASNPDLAGEDLRLFEGIRRKFSKNGIGLPDDERRVLEETTERISTLAAAFQTNISSYDKAPVFTSEELEGLPAPSLNVLGRNDDGNYVMDPRLENHLLAITTWATREETRLKAYQAHYSVAMNVNAPVMAELVQLRAKVAGLWGYETYADYVTEDRMAKDGENAIRFQTDLSQSLELKFRDEQQALLDLKVRETGNSDAVLNTWDIDFYKRMFIAEQFDVDTESVRNYFSMENCLQGVFTVCEKIFGVDIILQDPSIGGAWDEEVAFYQVNDSATGEPLGSFYLDLYPREGKFSHYATFFVTGGNTCPDGTRERPVSVLVGNFPSPEGDRPSLLSLYDVNTLFHEMGHVMHDLLFKGRYRWFCGFTVARDFGEVPSQMLEQWLTDPAVPALFAFNYQDPEDKLSADHLGVLMAAEQAFIATSQRFITAKSMIDLTLHTRFKESDDIDVVKVGNDALEKYYLPCAPDTALITRFGHLVSGYAAGYYGYQWADTIVYDLASEFRQSDEGFLDKELGMTLRKEIYEPGSSRDENESIQAFLGREWTTSAYLDYLGIE